MMGYVFLLMAALGGLGFAMASGNGENASPSEETEPRILVSEEAYDDGVWFQYAHDTETEICSVLISSGNGLRPQVIECTPEVMSLFPENTSATEANQ